MAEDGRKQGSDQGRPPTEADLDARRRALESKLDALERERSEKRDRDSRQGADASGMSRGFRYSADFVAGVLVGCGLGWLLDHFLGTRPWGLMIFIVLGFAAGTFNILRLAERERRERRD
jgi:ATP synthase protein I